MRNVKSVLAGKLDDVHQKILQIEASTLGKIGEVQSKIHQIEASNAEYRSNLIKDIEEKNNKNIKMIEGMGERLMKRIDDRIDELIDRQDKIFQEMISSREQQNNTVNIFKTDAADLIFKVNEVSEKITDFEKNKRNNLILFGVPNDHHETPTSLDSKVNKMFVLLFYENQQFVLQVQEIFRNMLLLRKEFEFSKVNSRDTVINVKLCTVIRYSKNKHILGVSHNNWPRGGELHACHDHIQVYKSTSK